MSCDAFECARCKKPMVADTNSARHTYVCSDDECGARSVIVPRAEGEPMRWDLPGKVVEFPVLGGGTPRPKDGASSDQSGGRDESESSTRAVLGSEKFDSALDLAASIVPGGVATLLDGDPDEIAAAMIEAFSKKDKG